MSARARTLSIALAIVLATVVAYAPSLPGDFIWDDDAHVTQNELLRDVEGLGAIWVPRNTPQYYPVTFSALWAEFQLWGLEPLGYHLVNLALHALNALLVWRLFARIRVRPAWLVAALFALHPVQVESVAWVMELKNVLSGTFYLLAALSYLGFDARLRAGQRASGRYALALALFVLALLSKSITCTLPAALVLWMLYEREPIGWRRLTPLAPLFAVGIALALYTAHLEQVHVGAQGHEFDYDLGERISISTRALLFYPWKLVAPWPLSFNYPRWTIDTGSLAAWWSAAAVIGLAALALWAYRRGRRGPALAAAFYAGTAFPALGLITYYPMLFSFVADHFVYLPSLGVLALIAAGAERAVRRLGWPAATSAVVALAAGVMTWFHSASFSDARTLYRHTIAGNPGSWLAKSELGSMLLVDAKSGRADDPARSLRESRELLQSAVALKDDHYMVQYNTALVLFTLGEHAAALPHAERATELLPEFVRWGDPPMIRGLILNAMGRPDQAEPWCERALERDPENYTANLFLGDRKLARGEKEAALAHFQAARRAVPNAASAREVDARIRLSSE